MDGRWEQVRAWLDRLRRSDPLPYRGHLSPEGMKAIWANALDVLDDHSLETVAAMRGEPYESAAMATARTVRTAPIEWCAVLLGRGSRLMLKHPSDDPGLTPLLVEAARAVHLPLDASSERSALAGAELLIAMGQDASIQQIAHAHRSAHLLGFGHRFSLAYITRQDSFDALAKDAAMHDGRGCMSPIFAATTLSLPLACEALAEAMARAEERWPRGEITAAEAAALRTHTAIARATGTVRSGPAWAVCGLPLDRLDITRLDAITLPRVLTLVSLPGEDALWEILAPFKDQISTIGADTALALPSEAIRAAAIGEMQRPPLIRLHDGIDWLRETLRATPSTGSSSRGHS